MSARRTLFLGVSVGLLAAAAGLYHGRAALERRWVAYRLPAIQAEARALLVSALGHPNKFVRIDSAGLLGRLGDPQGFGVLERATQDDNAIARRDALWRLVPFGDRALPFMEAGLHDEKGFVRDRAVQALGRIRTPAAHARLRALWNENRPISRKVLLGAFWASNPADTADLVCAELQTPTWLTRADAMQQWLWHRATLLDRAGRGSRDRMDLLVDDVLRDLAAGRDSDATDAIVFRWRLANDMAAADRDARAGLPPAERRRLFREQQARRAADLAPHLHDSAGLLAQLRDPDPERRVAVAQALLETPTAAALAAADARLPEEPTDRARKALTLLLVREDPIRAVPHLIFALKHDRAFPRQDAVEIIKAYPDPALVPVYAVALDSDYAYVRMAAVRALTEITHPDRRRLLYRALRDSNADIQVQAAGALLMPW